MDARSGELRLAGGGSGSGTFAAASGGVLNIESPYILLSNSIVTGTGAIHFSGNVAQIVAINGDYNVSGETLVSGGTINFNPGATVNSVGDTLTVSGGTANFDSGDPLSTTTLVFSGGTLTSGSDITVTDVISWTGGTMGGVGQTISNGILEIGQLSGSGGKVLDARTLQNNNRATWSGTGLNRINGRNGATIINSSGATFDIVSDGELLFVSGERPSFINEGVFTKSGGSGSTTVQFNFNNMGTVEAQSGTIHLNFLNFFTVYSQTAGVTNLNGGSFAVTGGGQFNMEGGTLLGVGVLDGDVANNGGQVSPGGVGASGILTPSPEIILRRLRVHSTSNWAAWLPGLNMINLWLAAVLRSMARSTSA